MKKIVVISLLLFHFGLFAQKKLSLNELEKKRTEIENLTLINLELALKKAELLLNTAQNSKSESEIAKAKSTLAYLKIFETKTSEAEILNNQSLKINLRLKNENEIAKNYLLVQKNYRGLANSYCDQKNYEMALKYASKALEFTKFESSISETSYINATIAEI